jgi:hypothetical protein
MAQFSCPASNQSPTWSTIDVLKWKLVPEKLGGGKAFIRRFKDGWVKHNRAQIKQLAAAKRIPPELLAGTAWVEVGGDPTFIDRVALEVRAFDWSGPKWVDDHLTITREPSRTSFGPVSMQLRTAARVMGIDPQTLSADDLRNLGSCFEKDVFNLQLVATHLHDLILFDFPKANTSALTPEQIKIVGARYNRGTGLSLDQIKQNTSYGNFLVNNWSHFTALLQDN